MTQTNARQLPVEYIYLDDPGIESLYAQTVDTVETAHTTTTQKGTARRLGGGLRLKNLIARLAGLEGEMSAESTGTRAYTEQSTRVQTVEQRLRKLLDFLSHSKQAYFTSLDDASRYLRSADGPVFVNVRDRFNAPQFYSGANGVAAVNADGYLLLEKGGAEDYHDRDDYYKQPTAVVRLAANIKKMRGGGSMGANSHEAIFIRGCGGRGVPLCIFGSLSGTFDYLQIKPFAIWK